MIDLSNIKISILGAARSGVAAARKAKQLGAHVLLSDIKSRDEIPSADLLAAEFECEFSGHSDRVLVA
ncbi:MAG: UDP-N-acetylmuramoyl-L-alanine--D-glutamate ligase, partial [Candidatus Cloacimonetes bacterium]|nr:UDP-N-acetylmuramoyl-L-alanine--D-glutamate ligase [Candidatus Cloacimonadota bacterium]